MLYLINPKIRFRPHNEAVFVFHVHDVRIANVMKHSLEIEKALRSILNRKDLENSTEVFAARHLLRSIDSGFSMRRKPYDKKPEPN